MNWVYADKNFIANAENEAMTTIITNYINISQNKYGNYLIQDLLENGGIRKKANILKIRNFVIKL
jgi:hypothetical protein